MRSRGIAVTVVVSCILSIGSPLSAKSPSPGSKCRKLGSSATTARGNLICKRVKGRLVWRLNKSKSAGQGAGKSTTTIPTGKSVARARKAVCDPSGSSVDQKFEFELNVDLSLPEEWRREFIRAMDNLQELAPISDCIFFLPEGNPMRSPLSVYAWSSEVSNPWPDERPGMSGACICGDGSTRWMALEINADEFKNDLLHRYAVIAHEYFHVFQIARSGDLMKPVWLVEGGAKTFEELFTKTYYGASEFDNGLFPVTANGLEDPSIFEKYVNVEGDRNYNFSSFMVLVLVNELKKIQGLNEREALRLVLADYWSNLQGRSSWQEVFEETFGMTASDVYEAVQAFKTEKSRKPWYSGDVVAVDEVQNLMPTGTLTLQDIFGSP